jgi:ribonuclease HI
MVGSDRLQRRRGHVRIFVHGHPGPVPTSIGVGVAVKDRSSRALDWFADCVAADSGALPAMVAVEHGLQVAAEMGARTVTVLVDDENAVRIVNREAEVPRDSVPCFIRVRALMNQLRKASVRMIPSEQNREARRLAEAAAANEPVSDVPASANLSLFPAMSE